MRIRVPSRKICERFLLIYELEGCQKAVNFIARHYGIRRMKIVLDGRSAGKGNRACYFDNKAYFKRKYFRKRLVLHELYHHIVEAKGLAMSRTREEKEADKFARVY